MRFTLEAVVSRRELFKLVGLAMADAVLARCAPVPIEERQSPIEIKGEVPGNYSEFIIEHDLIPSVLDDLETLTEEPVDYLRNYRRALELRSDLRGQPLQDYGINVARNYPLAIPRNWTVWDVVNTFLNELDHTSPTSGKTKITPSEVISGLLSTESRFIFDERVADWRRLSTIFVNVEKIARKGFFLEGADGSFRARFTDTELGLLMIHEFTHELQEEMLMQQIISDTTTIQQIGRDPEAMLGQVRQLETLFTDRLKEELFSNLSEEERQVFSPREAQANAVQFLLLEHLNQLNGTLLPGTRLQDPRPEAVVQLQGSDPEFINLYQLWSRVSRESGALNPEWLLKAGKGRRES